LLSLASARRMLISPLTRMPTAALTFMVTLTEPTVWDCALLARAPCRCRTCARSLAWRAMFTLTVRARLGGSCDDDRAGRRARGSPRARRGEHRTYRRAARQ